MAKRLLFFHSPYNPNSTVAFSNLIGGGVVPEVYYTELPQYRLSVMPTLIYVDEDGAELGRIEDVFQMNAAHVNEWIKQFEPAPELPEEEPTL
jgi:hypothetical protein